MVISEATEESRMIFSPFYLSIILYFFYIEYH